MILYGLNPNQMIPTAQALRQKGKAARSIVTFADQGFLDYVEGCGLLLAQAHAQSPNANWVAGYMGKSAAFEKAFVKWCYDYSKQVYRDYENFVR